MLGLAFRNLFRNIRRTIAILLTVGMGAGALFCFEGFIKGVQEEYQESTIHAHHGNGQINTLGYRETVYEDPSKHWISDYNELEEFLFDQEGVEYVFPRVSLSGMLSHNKVMISGQGQGILGEDEAEFFNSLNIEEGEMLYDVPNGIILGKGLAQALNVHPGDSLTFYTKTVGGKVSNAPLKVTGIFHTGNLDFDSHVFRIQLDQAQDLLDTHKIETVSLGLQNHAQWDKVAKAVEKQSPHLEATSFAVLNKVWYQHSIDWLNAQFHVVQIIILTIVLLGIFNTVSASVLERKQEIGNLRANGESSWDVLRLILFEGTLLGVLGSVFALSFTYLIAKVFLHQGILMPPGPGSTRQFFISFSFDIPMTIRVFSLSIIASIFASFLAGLKVIRMPIAKALRSY